MTITASLTVAMWFGHENPRRRGPAGLGVHRVAVIVILP
jgi:hypothetical protein